VIFYRREDKKIYFSVILPGKLFLWNFKSGYFGWKRLNKSYFPFANDLKSGCEKKVNSSKTHQ